MLFRLHSLRFTFQAVDRIRFPAGKPGNILRGALGTEFRQQVCDPECPGTKLCERRRTCPYARFFEPAATGEGPSGLSDWPRPFVFRAGHLDATTSHPGSSFHFDLNLFDLDESAVAHFIRAFRQLAREGLGPHRGKAHLDTVDQIGRDGALIRRIYDHRDDRIAATAAPLALDLRPASGPVQRLRVHFQTPTELKAEKRLAETPEFRVLISRCRDRISTLRDLYQDGALPIDFRAFAQRAGAVAMTRCEIQWRDIMRRSSKTGQVHPIGGFVGTAEYNGDLAEFLPFLRATQWTGVGRHTVWGKGAIRVERI